MTPEERSLLERTNKLAEQNNAILRSIQRTNRFSLVLRILYWVVIIAISYGAYYAIQPYMNQLFSLYSQVQQDAGVAHTTINSVSLLKGLLTK